MLLPSRSDLTRGHGGPPGLSSRGWPRRANRPDRIMGVDPRLVLTRVPLLAGEQKLFAGALAVGALLRLVASIGYPGALWFAGDSYVYLGAALRPQPNLAKTTGYSVVLHAL